MKRKALCVCGMMLLLICAVVAAIFWQSEKNAEVQRLEVARRFLETLYTGDSVRYQEHLRAAEPNSLWDAYYSDYEALATENCLSAMEHFQFVMVDTFVAESGAEVLIENIQISPIADDGAGDEIWEYYYSADFVVVLQGNHQSECYRAEGALGILHRKDSKPKVHSVQVSDTNLFEYILLREGL